MAAIGMNFDATQVDPTNHFQAIPAGEYQAIITKSEMKPTKNGTGQYLELTLEIQAGEFARRKLYDRLNLINQNHAARDIAQRQFSQICHAVGVLQCNDSEQLHFKPMTIIVGIDPAREYNGKMYDASNVVKGYKAIQGANQQQAAFQAPRVQAPQQQQFAPAPQQPMQPQFAPQPQMPQQAAPQMHPQAFAPQQAPMAPWAVAR